MNNAKAWVKLMFKGIPGLKEFLSTPEEWHALIIGFCQSFYKRRKMPKSIAEELSEEYHYYTTGRLAGHVVKFTAIAVLLVMLRRGK